MKNKKKFFIIGGSAISIILAVVLCIVLIPKHGEEKPTESEPTESSNSTVVIDEPVLPLQLRILNFRRQVQSPKQNKSVFARNARMRISILRRK